MAERKVDARGMLCPKPLIEVRKALTEMALGEGLTVLLDNDTACDNVVRFLRDAHAAPTAGQEGGIYTIRATKTANPVASPDPIVCSPVAPPRPPVLVLNHSGMGHGSEELGRVLIQGCLNCLKEVTPLPAAIVFYNAGVHLACEGSPVLAALSDLEQRGVRLLICGACLEYFELKTKRKVGIVSNMLEIMQTQARAGHVITP